MSRLKKFLALSGIEKRIFFKALCGLPLVHLRLRLLGFKKYLAQLQRIPLATIHPEIDPSTYPAHTSYLVNAAARLLFRREACLERSIMLWSMLRRKGIESELKIGVAKAHQELQAHAWVEIDDTAINEPRDAHQRFTAFDCSLTPEYRDFS